MANKNSLKNLKKGILFKKGHIPWSKGKKGVTFNSGRTHFKNGQNADEKNVNWKGDNVGYGSLHSWVRRNLGSPSECVYCGDVNNLDWASVSHNAKRDLSDYIPLCRKCHLGYDRAEIHPTQIRKDFYNRWSGKWEERGIN